MKPFSSESETSHSEWIYIADKQRRGFSTNKKMSKFRGLNLDEFEIFWDIYTAQKDYAYIVTLLGLRCVDDYVRAPVLERREQTLREKRYEKDVVIKTLVEKKIVRERDVVRKTL